MATPDRRPTRPIPGHLLTPRELVRTIVALEARRVDRVARGEATDAVDDLLWMARHNLVEREREPVAGYPEGPGR
jgi:hypothetical protein